MLLFCIINTFDLSVHAKIIYFFSKKNPDIWQYATTTSYFCDHTEYIFCRMKNRMSWTPGVQRGFLWDKRSQKNWLEVSECPVNF